MRIAALLLLVAPGTVFAWGSKGHAVTAALAERQLSAPAASEVRRLLFGQPLSSVASLPDDWRGEEDRNPNLPKTGPWHFVSIPNETLKYDAARDCANDDCVVAQIEKFRAVLADRCKPDNERQKALIYLTHFVGDVHQPLHAAKGMIRQAGGKMEPDRGGNLIQVTYKGANSNLHSIWDSYIIEAGPETVDEYVQYLLDYEQRGRTPDELEHGNSVEWAEESHYAAIESAYDIGSGRLGSDYERRNAPIVYERLLRGGVRLCRILDDVLAPPAKKPDCK
ncbi:MAG TPA: S1/P1 nuclease [Thermoanaerobaculia bacterium]|nr:S1/P1 nuclease [Thermoanaerobaculia bacterium]